jgi:hypothetical protein
MNAEKASQTVPLLKPDSAHSIARAGALKPGVASSAGPNKVHGANVATIVTPISPIAEPGNVSRINPSTTPAKIAKKYHAFWDNPAGQGVNATTIAATSGAVIVSSLLIGVRIAIPELDYSRLATRAGMLDYRDAKLKSDKQ